MYNFTTNPGKPQYHSREIHWYERPGRTFVMQGDNSIIYAETIIQTFVVTEKLKRHEIAQLKRRETDDGYVTEMVLMLKQRLRDHVSYYGLLIEDSVTVFEEPNVTDDSWRIGARARVICPTLAPKHLDPKAPKRRKCERCQAYSFESAFHSGTCENCGAPYPGSEFPYDPATDNHW